MFQGVSDDTNTINFISLSAECVSNPIVRVIKCCQKGGLGERFRIAQRLIDISRISD